MRSLLMLLCALLLASPLPAEELPGELVKMVVLSRHGVRSPTQEAKILQAWTQKPWPQWPVARGDLTPRGAQLIAAMWANMKSSLESRGLLEARECPKVYVRADVDERTQATARALLHGLAPHCKLSYEVAQSKIDPLFHPVKAGLYRYDAIIVATDVLARTHGGLDRLLDDFAGPMALLNNITGAPAPFLCARFALTPRCQLTDLPNAISVSADGTGIRIVGSLGIASSMAEIFLLEYAQWPDALPGWGQVDAKILGQLLPIHAKVFDVVNRANAVAWANGSALLRDMSAALLGSHSQKAINDARLVVYVGHDTNIANVGGLLGLNWHVPGYPANGIPPGGALCLELWRKNGVLTVIPRFYAQPMAALHRPLAADSEDMAPFAPIGVETRGENGPSQFEAGAFKRLVDKLTSGAPMPSPEELKGGEVQWGEAG